MSDALPIVPPRHLEVVVAREKFEKKRLMRNVLGLRIRERIAFVHTRK